MNAEEASGICRGLPASFNQPDNLLALARLQLWRTAAHPAFLPGRGNPGERSPLQHRPFELGERSDYLHHHASRRRRRTDRLGEASESSLPFLDTLHERQYIAQ